MAMERARARWERLAPRERRLVVLVGLTTLACVFGLLIMQVQDGLAAIRAKNAETQAALHTLTQNRAEILAHRSAPGDAAATIGDEAPRLATYLETIANEVGIQIPESTERPPTTKGKFLERTVEVKLRGLSVEQLANFLAKVETQSPIVVTQRLFVKRSSFSQDGKLDAVELTVGTYERARKDKGESRGDKLDAGPAKAVDQGGEE